MVALEITATLPDYIVVPATAMPEGEKANVWSAAVKVTTPMARGNGEAAATGAGIGLGSDCDSPFTAMLYAP